MQQKVLKAVANPLQPWAIMLLAMVVTAIGPFAADSYLPSLPSIVRLFDTTTGEIQLTITLYLLGFALSQLIYGPLSDRYGRRVIILWGLSISLVGSVLCTIAPTAEILVLARLLQGSGMGVCNALFRAIMRDTFSGAQLAKMASYAGMVFSVAPALAPIIGGYLQASFNWRANFVFITLLVMITWLVIWRFLPETNRNLNPQATQLNTVLSNYRHILGNKSFLGYALCSSLAFSGLIAYCAISPFLFQTVLGLSPVAYGWLGITITVGLLLGQFCNSLLVSRLGMQCIMVLGIMAMLLSGMAMWLIGYLGYLNVAVVIIPTSIFIASSGLIFANAMAGAFGPFAHMAGATAAVYGCLQVFGSFLTSLLVAGLHARNQMILAAIFMLLALCSLLIFYTLVNKPVVARPVADEA